jgi:hypothetical protein
MNSTGIEDVFVELKGKRAWGLVRTHGSMFFLEIGAFRTPEHGDRGQWQFLVQMCPWRFETLDSTIVGSDDDTRVINQVFATLELGTIESCTAFPPSYDLAIVFSTGLSLRTFSALTEPEDESTEWSLYTPDDYVWVSESGGSLHCQSIFT